MLRTSFRSAQAVRSARPLATATTTAKAGSLYRLSRAAVSQACLSTGPTRVTVARPLRASVASQRCYADAAPTPVKKAGFFRKLRNYVLTLSVLGALAFGGGVWYSRVNDNFHDFFTEYVPYGEEAVLYLEELDFQKRIPGLGSLGFGGSSSNAAAASSALAKERDTAAHVRVPAHSGASWRVASTDSRQKAAVTAEAAEKAEKEKAEKKAAEKKAEKAAEKKAAEKEKAVVEPQVKAAAAPAKAATTTKPTSPYKAPEVDEPSRWPPASPIDPLGVRDAAEPVVQDVVHILNDIITVINADGASDRYGATIGKAKATVQQVGSKVAAIRQAAEQAAAAQVQARSAAFDQAAHDLVGRVEAAMATQEAQWRAQFDEEMERMRRHYDERVQLATARERQLSEEKLQNQLLEQAVQMTQQFAAELQARVEAERAGRLGRLRDLAAEVAELERLTAGWTDLIDSSQRAQQLHVALDAARARLAEADAPSSTPSAASTLPGYAPPFIRELVAIKEIAAGDPVVDAAIASIPPAAYQRGVASPAELIDRFRRVAAEVRKAALLPDDDADAGVASHASSYVLSKVLLFQPSASSASSAVSGAGNEVDRILARTQAFLEEGNLDDAAREMNGLKGWAKTLSRDWLGEVRKVLEVQQALDVITAEARLRSLQLESR